MYFRLAIDPLLWPWTHSSGHGLTRLVMDSLVWSWTRLAVDSLVRPELLSLLLLKAELSKKKTLELEGHCLYLNLDKDCFSCHLRGAGVRVVAFKAKGRGFKWVQIHLWLFKQDAEALDSRPRLLF